MKENGDRPVQRPAVQNVTTSDRKKVSAQTAASCSTQRQSGTFHGIILGGRALDHESKKGLGFRPGPDGHILDTLGIKMPRCEESVGAEKIALILLSPPCRVSMGMKALSLGARTGNCFDTMEKNSFSWKQARARSFLRVAARVLCWTDRCVKACCLWKEESRPCRASGIHDGWRAWFWLLH